MSEATVMRRPSGAALLVALAVACGAPPDPGAEPPPPPDPDARFLDETPCPAAGGGLALEETGAFSPGGDPDGVVVIMGGSTEVDSAAIRFAAGARGGDLLVLRATGSTSSYTTWFADELPIDPAPGAVGTIRVDDPARGGDDTVLCRVARADAIWLAGGDQSDYLVRWPAALHQALARAVARGVAVGGTSAGAMSLGSPAFDAERASVTSEEAVAFPLSPDITLRPSPFVAPALDGVLVDTHFSERDRLGRLVAFVARAERDGGVAVGLGIDEQTAVVLTPATSDDGARTVAVEGAGEAWLVALEGAADLTSGLRATAQVAPLSLQTAWPPVSGAEAPGASLVAFGAAAGP